MLGGGRKKERKEETPVRTDKKERLEGRKVFEASASADSTSKKVQKTTFDFCTEMYGAPAENLIEPRKPRCVDFVMQIYSNAK